MVYQYNKMQTRKINKEVSTLRLVEEVGWVINAFDCICSK